MMMLPEGKRLIEGIVRMNIGLRRKFGNVIEEDAGEYGSNEIDHDNDQDHDND